MTEEDADIGEQKKREAKDFIAGVDYEVPDHESYRTSRRNNDDERCDKWFGDLLGDDKQVGIMGSLAGDARKILLQPVPLINEVREQAKRGFR